MKRYVVQGLYLMPYCMILLPTKIKEFSSRPIRAKDPQHAINTIYERMDLQFATDTTINGKKVEEISDDELVQVSDKELNRATLATMPIDMGRWTATECQNQ